MLAAAQLPASEAPLQARNPRLGDFCPAANDNVKEISSLGPESRWGTENLDYMHARYYNPMLGRFLSFDPIGGNPAAPQSWNRYAYVLNNPVNYIDPEGLAVVDSCSRSGSSVSCEGSITVPAELGDAEGYDPLTGVQGLQDLVLGAAFFNSSHGAPEGYGYGGVRLRDALANAPGVPCSGGYTCEILSSFRAELPVLHAMEMGVVHFAGATVGGAGFRLFGNVARGGLGLFGTSGRVGQLGYTLSAHAGEQMAARGVTGSMVGTALRSGTRFHDPVYGTVVFGLREGFVSGQSLAVHVNPATKTIITVVKGTRALMSRFVPAPP